MKPYQAGDGKWVLFDELKQTKRYFNTQAEAIMAEKKKVFSNAVITSLTGIAKVTDEFENMETIYISRGYAGNGSDPLTADDVSETGLTLTQFNQVVTFIQNYLKLIRNQVPTQGNYNVTIDIARNDL